MHQLIAQLMLAVLSIIEGLQDGKRADAVLPAQHRNHCDAYIHIVDADYPGLYLLFCLKALNKRQIGQGGRCLLMHHQRAAQPRNRFRLPVHGKYLGPLIDTDDSLVQYLHQYVKLAFQPSGPGEHHVKIVGAGDHT